MAIVVKCPGCEKKLKLNQPTPGKKIRCPGCKEPFVPVKAKKKAQSGGKPKRKAAPVDDFGDDGFEDDYGEAPQPRRKSSGTKKSSKKKAAAAGKSKAPLFIGIGVLGLALAGGLTFMLWPDGDGGDTTAANGASEGVDEASEEGDPGMGELSDAEEHGDDSQAGSGGAVAARGGGGAPGAMGPPPGTGGPPAESSISSGSTPQTAITTSTAVGTAGPLDLSMLPTSAEVAVHVDVGRLVDGPLGQLLTSPPISDEIAKFEQMTGFGPKDISTVTVGIGGITDAIKNDQKPSPESMPGIAVIRTKIPIDAAKIQSLIPNAEAVTEGTISYVRVPDDVPAGIWVADSNTVVIGAEKWLKQSAANPSSPTGLDGELLDGKSTVQVVFSPNDPEMLFRGLNQGKFPPGMPPASLEMIKTFLATAKSASLGIEFTNDFGVSMAARCMDSAGAAKLAKALKDSSDEGKAMRQGQQVPPMMAPLMEIQTALEDSMKLTAEGDLCRMSMLAEGGGEKIGTFIPMAQMMMGPAIAQARNAARRTQSKNNLKQIALAMHNFNSVYSRFPNAIAKSPEGQVCLSWRVHLLPFLGHEDLYKQFALLEPWDSETNKPLVAQMPDVYKSPKAPLEDGKTIYQVPVGPGSAFEDGKGYAMKDFTDGTVNTIFLLEVSPDRAVYWTQPEDWKFDPSNPKDGLGGVVTGGFQAAMAAGNVLVVQMTTDDAALKGMFTRNGAD